jgi:hypothetical protein
MIGTLAVAVAGTLALAAKGGRALTPHLAAGGQQVKDAASHAWLFFLVALTAGRGQDGGSAN